MNKFLIELKIERLYRRGNKLLERLDYIVAEHAKHRQETEEIDEFDNNVKRIRTRLKKRFIRHKRKAFQSLSEVWAQVQFV